MAEMYLTFGGMYAREAHPTFEGAHPDGWLTVEYPERALWGADDRERARLTAWAWLEGHYAFDYDEPPSLDLYPRGEIGRMVLP